MVDTASVRSCLHDGYYHLHKELFKLLFLPTARVVGAGDNPLQIIGDTQSLLLKIEPTLYLNILHPFTVLYAWGTNYDGYLGIDVLE